MNKKVLLIEDLPVIQNLYGDFLNEHGFIVDIAPDGKVALEKVKLQAYDLILLDLLLPTINGIGFLEQFKDRPKQTKIVVLSDFSEPKTVEQAQKLGIETYLIKAENTPSQLVEKLNSMSSAQK